MGIKRMIGRTNAGIAGTKYSIKNWCATVGLSYNTLSEITEADMRTLMTKYASVAYFMEWYSADSTMITDFIASAKAMKWIGLRDYICDKLMAISDFKTKALASDNWEFILKDHVPIMTSASAPYGKASASSTYSTDYAWQAFDGNNSTRWVANASDSYIDYEFTNPICVRKVYYYSLTYVTKVSLHGSNGGTWTKIGEYECSGVFNQDGYFEIDNNNYYKSYRIKSEVIMSSSATMQAMTLQFYGRALNVSVPTMTGNSSPYGEVSVDYKGASADVRPTNQAYMAFLSSGLYASPHLVGQSVSYDFGRPIIVKYVTFTLDDANAHTSSDKVKVQGSNDKTTWVDLSDSLGGGARPTISTTINNNVAYRYYQIVVAELTSASSYFQIRSINFFGLDYSERSDRTYLYDHGVEVVPMSTYASGSGVTISKNANDITISDTTTSYWGVAGTTNAIDLTAYSKVRAIVADKYATSVSGGFIISTTRNALASWSSFANANITSVMLPYGINLDVSSVNESVRVGLVTTSSNTDASMNFNELWLE